ncbi:unnamed protein product, partial [Prorocentrum cordatum]
VSSLPGASAPPPDEAAGHEEALAPGCYPDPSLTLEALAYDGHRGPSLSMECPSLETLLQEMQNAVAAADIKLERLERFEDDSVRSRPTSTPRSRGDGSRPPEPPTPLPSARSASPRRPE